MPPRLNERGLAFAAAGYRFTDGTVDRRATVAPAVWNTVDAEWRHSADLSKAFPSRVGLISAGPIGSRLSYFAEWRALSQSLQRNGRLLNRSGRFEDLFLRAPIGMGGSIALTAGQFRTLSQVDVSQRLGSCAVMFTDGRGSTHTVVVSAESLFEAAVLGVDRLRRDGFLEEAPGPATRLQIEVREPSVTHTVSVHQIRRWLEEWGTNPAEITKKRRLKEILG